MNAQAQLLDPLAVDVETDHIEVAGEFDCEGKTDVAQAQDGDGRIHGVRLVADHRATGLSKCGWRLWPGVGTGHPLSAESTGAGATCTGIDG